MSKPFKLAIAGLGHIADKHQAALQRIRSLEVVATCDLDPSKQRDYPGRFYTDVDKMLDIEGDNVDALFVAVPNQHHYEVAKKGLARGKHVLVEKPAVQRLEEFDELTALADEKGVVLQSAYHAQFGPEVIWFNGHDTSAYGPLTGFSAGFFDPYVSSNGQAGPEVESLQGSWTDSGINALSVLLPWIPDLEVEEARMTLDPEIAGLVYFSFSGGRRGHVDTNWTLGLNRKTTELEYAKTGTRILLDHSKQRVLRTVGADRPEVLAKLDDDDRLTAQYFNLFRNFAHHMEDGTDNRERSRRCLELLLKAKE